MAYKSNTKILNHDKDAAKVYIITRKVDRGGCMDCKVVPGESVVTQHRLLILDVRIRRRFRKIKRKLDPKIKW